MVRRLEDVDKVIAFARALPDFPVKNTILECLETRNLNRYQQAMLLIAEAKLNLAGNKEECDSLEQLEDRIKRLEASDPIAD